MIATESVETTVSDLEILREKLQPVEPEDPMAEAARKVLLGEFIRMLEHEDGSRTGEDIEDVHQMRVATRRMRSALRQMGQFFKPKTTEKLTNNLKTVASALGEVRDLDVMIGNLHQYQGTLEADEAEALQQVFNLLDEARAEARSALIDVLDSKAYQKFVESYESFLTTPQSDQNITIEDGVVPYQVRHILPNMIQDHLSQIKAYEVVLENATYEQLHNLRIEFKRLRYITSFFEGVLGTSTDKFITELKQIQDHLGELNDAKVAIWTLRPVMKKFSKGDPARDALKKYLDYNKEKAETLMAEFPAVWEHFNTRTVQRQLANALLTLR